MSTFLDRYSRSKSVCHALSPLAKLLLTFVVVLSGFAVPSDIWPAYGVLVALVFAGQSLARIPLSYLLRRLALFLPVLLVLSLSFPLAQGFQSGWEIMVTVMGRSTLAFVASLWLVNVMPFDQLLATLRKLHVPDALISALSFMYRYLFVLWDELEKMQSARKARTFGRQGIWFWWITSAQMVGMLLIRAMGRADRVHGAMCARGWDGRVRTLD